MSGLFGAALVLAMLSSDEVCSAKLDRLLALSREYGLPLPPPDASLVRYVPRPQVVFREGRRVTDRGGPALAFSRDGRTVLDYSGDSFEVESLASVKPDLTAIGDDVDLGWLDSAIHYHARGWGPLAQTTFRQWTLFAGVPRTPEAQVCSHAWHYWKGRLHQDPGAPLELVAKYMKRVLPDSPHDTWRNRELIRCLELALKPRNSPPGSDDALIDDLIELTGNVHFSNHFGQPTREDPRYRAIVRRGLAAVPALIAHLKDDRLTRVVGTEPWSDQHHYRVKDVALDILRELAGGRYRLAEGTLDEQLAEVGKWLAQAERLGEEQYLASGLLGDENDSEFRPTLFWLLAEKYPQRVPAVYRALLDTRPGHAPHGWRFAKALAEGPLAPAEKRKVLEHAARHTNARHRWAGIQYLRLLDPKLAHDLLLSGLKAMPADPTDAELRLASVAAEVADPDEWRELRLLVRRAGAGLRLEMLDAVARSKGSEGHKLRLALLAEYLTDDAERDAFDERGRWPVHGFPRLEVRNFAAMRLAELFKLDPEPDADWSESRWAELRANVRAKVNEELRR